MDGNRDNRRDDRRRKYDRDRSQSPPPRDRRDNRRDDRRRSRSPPRGPPGRGGYRNHREREYRGRDRQPSSTPPPSYRKGDDRRPSTRQPLDSRSHNAPDGRGKQDPRPTKDMRMEDVPEDEDSEAEMQRVMGFKGFRSTKNTKVPGNDKNHGVFKAKATEYRQYMNRQGGFNRPLSPSRM